MSSLWSQPFADDIAVFNRWLCVSRIRAAAAVGLFFPLLHVLGMVHLHVAPVLLVNAAEVNFVESDLDFQSLLAYVRHVKSGRHFFNPLPAEVRA